MKPTAPPAKKASPAAPTPSKKAAAPPRKKSNEPESSSGSIFEKEALKYMPLQRAIVLTYALSSLRTVCVDCGPVRKSFLLSIHGSYAGT